MVKIAPQQTGSIVIRPPGTLASLPPPAHLIPRTGGSGAGCLLRLAAGACPQPVPRPHAASRARPGPGQPGGADRARVPAGEGGCGWKWFSVCVACTVRGLLRVGYRNIGHGLAPTCMSCKGPGLSSAGALLAGRCRGTWPACSVLVMLLPAQHSSQPACSPSTACSDCPVLCPAPACNTGILHALRGARGGTAA